MHEWRLTMANPPRRKGTSAETQVVDWFHKIGEPQVERHALHGNHDLGDLTGVPGCVVSVKFVGKGKPINLSGWLNDLAVMQRNVNLRTPDFEEPLGLLIVRRAGYRDPGDWYAVQPLRDWWDLYRELLT